MKIPPVDKGIEHWYSAANYLTRYGYLQVVHLFQPTAQKAIETRQD